MVLNGGVSLAVWMGGVTHELNRIRLASMPAVSDVPDDVGPWREILEKAGRHAVVDLVAGTSAGGLNGTVLASAIATGATMPPMGSVWSKTAALSARHLVRQDRKKIARAKSVLDGDYFMAEVADLLGDMKADPDREQDCTLLVTATALDSTILQTPLETGSSMSMRDGRRVYKFDKKCNRALAPADGPSTPRPTTGTDHFDFGKDGSAKDALALAARASASFPVAFAPVYETSGLRARRIVPSDDRVGRSWLVDGGVLDNAPIEPLLAALRERPTDQPYERVMLYITPGVGLSAGAVSSSKGTPTMKQTMTSVLSAMREPDERLDMDSLRLIFDEMSLTRTHAHNMITAFLKNPSPELLGTLQSAAGLMFEHYRLARAEAFERYLQSKSGEMQTSPLLPPESPTLQPDCVPGMPPVAPPAATGQPRTVPALSAEGEWLWGAAAADRCVRWWGRALSAMCDPADQHQAKTIAEAMSKIAVAQQEISRLGKVIGGCVSGTPTNVMRTGVQLRNLDALYTKGSPALDKLYGAKSGSLSKRLGAIMSAATDAMHEAVGNVSVSEHLAIAISVEVLTGWRAWGGADYDVPEFRFHNVTPAVEPPACIPLENLPTLSDWPIKKLYGQRLGHFGAFVSKDGRRDDWLWGRLDGANELSKQLLASAGILGDDADEVIKPLILQILAAEGPYTPQAFVKRAVETYTKDNRDLLDTLRENTDTVNKLEDTLWALSCQFEPAGLWLRALLQPDWSEDQLENVMPRSDKRFKKTLRRLRLGRCGVGVAMRLFRGMLPPELQYAARRQPPNSRLDLRMPIEEEI